MSSNRPPHAVALDQLVQPVPGGYAFECVADRGDLARSTAFNKVEVTQSMSGIIKELGEAVAANSLDMRFWHPARVVRGVMDHAAPLPLVTDAAQVAAELYARPGSCTSLEPFAEDIERHGLGDAAVYQKADILTMEAERPICAERVAGKIATDIGGPALFLANCHGGLIPTIQTALTHERQFPGNLLVPIRFSIHKQKSHMPQLMPEELQLIAEASKDRPIVVHDDDATGGDTLRRLVRYLSAHLPGDRDISAYVSRDLRKPETKSRLGRRWERSTVETQSDFMMGSY